MSKFLFLENEYLTSKTKKYQKSGDKIEYQYSVCNGEKIYKGEITIDKSRAEVSSRYMMKVGSGNMWMSLDSLEIPIWFQELVTESKEFIKNREIRRKSKYKKLSGGLIPTHFHSITKTMNQHPFLFGMLVAIVVFFLLQNFIIY